MDKRVEKLALNLLNHSVKLQKNEKILIEMIGTDLTFSVEGIKAEKYFGTYNIPDGEVATCPTKYSTNGYITYNTETVYNGITFKNIYFELKDGRFILEKLKPLNPENLI